MFFRGRGGCTTIPYGRQSDELNRSHMTSVPHRPSERNGHVKEGLADQRDSRSRERDWSISSTHLTESAKNNRLKGGWNTSEDPFRDLDVEAQTDIVWLVQYLYLYITYGNQLYTQRDVASVLVKYNIWHCFVRWGHRCLCCVNESGEACYIMVKVTSPLMFMSMT